MATTKKGWIKPKKDGDEKKPSASEKAATPGKSRREVLYDRTKPRG